MRRLHEIKTRGHPAAQAGSRRGTSPVVVTSLAIVLAALVTACQRTPTSGEAVLPPHLQLSPCGGETRVQWPGDSRWWVVEAPIAVDDGAQIAAHDADGGRLCATDGSVLELASGTTVDLGATGDRSRLNIALEEGSLLLLAVRPAYHFAAPGCSLYVTEVPARVSMAVRADTTQLRVESGRATCVLARETLDLGPCAEIVAAPGMEPDVTESCDGVRPATAVAATISPTPTQDPTGATLPPASPSPTGTPVTTSTPIGTPMPTSTQRPAVPTNTPTSPPSPTATPPEPTPIP